MNAWRPAVHLWAVFGLLALAGGSLAAAPVGWEEDYGPPLAGLTGQDDAAQPVALSFPFPYAGQTYTGMHVGTNGAVALGGPGEADDYPSGNEFADTTSPMLAPFWTDLSLASQGSVHFEDSGDRAVVTWNGVGSYENETASFTFQLQIFADGRVLFLYNGIPPLTDENIDEDTCVGLTEGNLPQAPLSDDFTAEDEILVGNSAREVFVVNSGFDLDGQSLLFSPHPDGGFVADASITTQMDRPAIWERQYGEALTGFDDLDDGSQMVSLSFDFPYGGQTYRNIHAGTNGAIGLGERGEANDYPSGDEFLETAAPMFACFWSDMSADEQGAIYFNDFGDHAVFTWRQIGTYMSPTEPFTFQLQLHSDGTVVLAYNGISRIDSDNIDVDVHVGLTPGNLAAMPDGAEVDYTSQAPFASGITVLEVFPVDGFFDLDLQTIVFHPIDASGYEVSVLPPQLAPRPVPAIWEAQYGPALDAFDELDDGTQMVTLGFEFPYGGRTYRDIYVGTNSAIGLGGHGEANDYPSGDEFLTTGAPLLAPFWSDMSAEDRGTIHFSDFGDRAAVTWNGIGSYENSTIPFTFQVQVYSSGRIVFAYNGIPAISADNIDETVHVGLTPGNLTAMPDGAEVDYTGQAPFTSGITVLETFPVDGIFDLDARTIVFDPIDSTGYAVSVLEPQPFAPEGVTIIGIARGPNGVQFNWATEAGVTYTVQSQRVPGGEWTDLATVAGTGAETAFIDTRPLAHAAFYRVLR